MKLFTTNQLRFAGAIFILTILFRYGLSYSVSVKNNSLIIIIALVYAICMFTLGWIFGKKDYLDLPLYDIGFRFHATTYIICNSIAELWFLFGFSTGSENINSVHKTIIIWGILLIIHFIVFIVIRKNAIKGIKKTEIFE